MQEFIRAREGAMRSCYIIERVKYNDCTLFLNFFLIKSIRLQVQERGIDRKICGSFGPEAVRVDAPAVAATVIHRRIKAVKKFFFFFR